MFKSLTEKHHTIDHMIIFNDPISKFYQYSIKVFAEAYLCFLVSASAKKNAEVIKFLEMLKKYVSKKWNIETMLSFPYSNN